MDLYEALAGSIRPETDYFQSNPLYISGLGIAQAPLPQARTNAEAILGPLVRGLAGGTLLGFGRNQAYDEAYGDARKNSLLQSLSPYQSSSRPEGWNPRQGQTDAIIEALKQQQEYQKGIEQLKQSVELQKALLPYGPLASQAARDKATAEIQGKTAGYGGEIGSNPEDPRLQSEGNILKALSGRKESEQLSDAIPILKTMISSFPDKSKASDAAFLYGLPKLLDPSTVKEGEIRLMMQNQPGLLSFAKEIEGAFIGTNRLGDDARAAIIKIAKDRVDALGGQYNLAASPYTAQIEQQKLNTQRALPFQMYDPAQLKIPTVQTPEAFIADLKARGVDQITAQKLFNEKFPGL